MAHARSTSDDDAPPLLATVRALSGSPLIYVGAVTVVAAVEIAEALPLGETAGTLALLPIALGLLYGQLAALVSYRRWRGGAACR